MPIGLSPAKTKKKTSTTLSRADLGLGGTSGDNSIGGSTTKLNRPTTYSTSGSNSLGGTVTNPIAAASGSPPIQSAPIIGNPNVNQTGAISSAASSGTGGILGGNMPTTGGQGQFAGDTTTDPVTGWLAQMGYTGGDVMGNNQMPAKYLYDILQNQGMDPTGGLFYMMEPLADIMMPLYEIMNGVGDINNRFTPESIGNFMGNTWNEFMTPGGRMPQQQNLVNNLLGTTGTDSALGAVMNVGSPEERIENMRKYMMLVGNLSGSPMYQQALSNVLSQGGYNYLDQFSGGNDPGQTFGQSLIGNYGPLFGFS